MSKFNIELDKDILITEYKERPIPPENYLKNFPAAYSRIAPRDQTECTVSRKSRRTKAIEDYRQRYINTPVRIRSDDNVLGSDNYQYRLVRDLQRRHTDILDSPENTTAVNQLIEMHSSQSTVEKSGSSHTSESDGYHGLFYDSSFSLDYVPVADSIPDDSLSIESELSKVSAIGATAVTTPPETDTDAAGTSTNTDLPSPSRTPPQDTLHQDSRLHDNQSPDTEPQESD